MDLCVLPAIFQHKIRHEGCALTRGTKYVLRTDVIYVAPGKIGTPQWPPAESAVT